KDEMITDSPIGLGTAKADGDHIRNADESSFAREVIAASNELPVIVDFWAEWCSPCRQLTPLLEKVVGEAGGKVRLVKVNVDENQALAAQLRIQSLPTVMIFAGGQPVDTFTGLVPESQIRDLVKRLAGAAGGSPADELITEGAALLDAGAGEEALQIFTQAAALEPASPGAIGGLAKAYLALGRPEEAKGLLESLPEDGRDHALYTSAAATLELMAEAPDGADGADLADLEERLEANPDDHEARFELAQAHQATGNLEKAGEKLLEIIAREREWNDEAARRQLLKLFEAAGPTSPFTTEYRSRLSSVYFS
ncbi:MAG: thioredoxin, partial [Sphingomonadales bacterium]